MKELQLEIRDKRRERSRNSGKRKRRGRKVTPLTLLEISQELEEEIQEVLGTS